MDKPYLSIIIPVYNEGEGLEALNAQLLSLLDSLGKSYEIIFSNDGSTDNSALILDQLQARHPKIIRVIHLNTNYGPDLAIMAALERVRGEVIITLEANAQTSAADVQALLEKIAVGHDVVSGYRQNPQPRFRRWRSTLHHWAHTKMLPKKLTLRDPACMLRAYRRSVVDLMIAGKELNTFVPALGLSYAQNPIEIPVSYQSPTRQSKYSLYGIIRHNLDLFTSFSLKPLHFFTLLGLSLSALSGLLVIGMLLRRLFDGPELQGVFTLFTIAFFFVGLCLLGLGILGEYIGRIYQEVRGRPRYLIRRILGKKYES